jgi:hypothetical protein
MRYVLRYLSFNNDDFNADCSLEELSATTVSYSPKLPLLTSLLILLRAYFSPLLIILHVSILLLLLSFVSFFFSSSTVHNNRHPNSVRPRPGPLATTSSISAIIPSLTKASASYPFVENKPDDSKDPDEVRTKRPPSSGLPCCREAYQHAILNTICVSRPPQSELKSRCLLLSFNNKYLG